MPVGQHCPCTAVPTSILSSPQEVGARQGLQEALPPSLPSSSPGLLVALHPQEHSWLLGYPQWAARDTRWQSGAALVTSLPARSILLHARCSSNVASGM